MDLHQIISSEHAAITNAFDRYLALNKKVFDWKVFISFCDLFIEKNHHTKEEKLIFSAVRLDPRIRMGGPLCTLYFDQYLQEPAIARAQRVIKETLADLKLNLIDVDSIIKPIWGDEFAKDLSSNSPLLIPAGDHVAGQIILRFSRELLNYYEAVGADQYAQTISLELLQKSLKILFFHYREIQIDHFVREENCFLKMCQSLISAEEWAQLANKMLAQYPLVTEDQLAMHFAKDQ